MNKLPKEFKEKWIAALRSGEYKQGKYDLYNRDKNSFCCLGVAGHLNGCSLESMEGMSSQLDKIYYEVIPESDYETRSYLARMNDSGKSFEEIANWIEEHL